MWLSMIFMVNVQLEQSQERVKLPPSTSTVVAVKLDHDVVTLFVREGAQRSLKLTFNSL